MFTGHNSYLTGNQLSSDSSVEPIIKALLKGVRVIELDLWPGSKKDAVEVRHGGTLTNPVDLLVCLKAIKDNAFQASEYPVVITFEDHLPENLQAQVAEMVTKTFGDMLYRPETDQLQEFPSPESLKKKNNGMVRRHLPKVISKPSDKDEVDDGENLQEEEEEMTVPEYMHLISIHAGKPKVNKNLKTATRRHGTDIVRFTQRNLLRVYPKGTRITSSNYNPFVGWAHGAQMVAFNMQGHAKHLWVKKILKVTIYMGVGWDLDFRRTHFDMYSPPDFFVKVGIAGVPADKDMKETKAIEDDWQPVWNQRFEFRLTVPELAVLRITVLEYDTSGQHDFGGQTCLPISELRTGIRAIPLHDRRGDKYRNTRLLVQFELN
ncbi:hypothetical protein OIU84_025567 [Salix udensis]|uniref:Phosphoinositide phospholipase C n=1 Tax=Salix udensis TaxID=889485 RepID=A0AAD6KJV7_9ROSI|nr:hypothetical protein OIU84_025567 [Salix udensis]